MGLISRVSSRTYRKKAEKFLIMVKTIHGQNEASVEAFGADVKLVVKGQKITVTGPRGTETRDLSHLKVELKKTGPQSVRTTKWWGSKLDLAALRTAESHVHNMAKGVTSGFRSKMRTVYAHFPSTATSPMKEKLLKSVISS